MCVAQTGESACMLITVILSDHIDEAHELLLLLKNIYYYDFNY